MEAKAEVCFEASWEACNKVGGIYTVVKSKIVPMKEQYGDNYFLIGPHFPQKAYGIFEESPPPEEWKGAFDALAKEGIQVHFGTWVTGGNPNVLLLDFSEFTKNANEVKRKLWEWYQVDTLNTEWFDFDEPVVWAFAVGRVIEELSKVIQKKMVAHFHEWLAGAAALYLRHQNVPVGTVFTTHATTLGRALATRDRNIYQELESINPDEEAKNCGPSTCAKHLMEKQAAQNAHVFTTVSEITGIEAEHFLGRKPDVLLFNGLDMSKFPTFEEASVRHKLFKSRIKQFLMYHFFPYYQFDLNNTLIYFIAGRYEYRDKGVDVFIKALARLNEQLKAEEDCEKTVVAFFWIPGNVKAIRPTLLQNKTLFEDIQDSVEDRHEDIHDRLLYALVTGEELSREMVMSDDLLQELKPKVNRFKREGAPPLSTHELFNEKDDAIMNALRSEGLDNKKDDRVKVVFYPIYLSGADGLLDTSYYESMQGSHLGVFPSFYEPWGYTPLEAAALGVSSITTDLAGFGRYICFECQQPKTPGIFVLERMGKSDEEIVASLTEMMSRFAHYSAKERTENKITAQKLAHTASWSKFIARYVEAHNKAIETL